MKILHALVGYLTVTTLPFHPFAFASPLAAIDYDGYVNTTLYQSDSALVKRVPGDIILEARQADIIIPSALIVAGIFALVVTSINWIEDDDPRRAAFTQNSVTKSFSKYPSFNWVICHTPHSVAFNGVEDTDWGHKHYELEISFFRTIGYDIYWARSGTFNRYGDGGYINWAYEGNVLRTDGRSITFGTL